MSNKKQETHLLDPVFLKWISLKSEWGCMLAHLLFPFGSLLVRVGASGAIFWRNSDSERNKNQRGDKNLKEACCTHRWDRACPKSSLYQPACPPPSPKPDSAEITFLDTLWTAAFLYYLVYFVALGRHHIFLQVVIGLLLPAYMFVHVVFLAKMSFRLIHIHLCRMCSTYIYISNIKFP